MLVRRWRTIYSFCVGVLPSARIIIATRRVLYRRMPFRIDCACGARLKIEDRLAGTTGECPVCKNRLLLNPSVIKRIPRLVDLDDVECDDEDEEDDEQQGRFICPFCRSNARPIVKSKVSTGGWVLFVVLLLFCFPLCLIGLLVKEDYRICSSCGIKLD